MSMTCSRVAEWIEEKVSRPIAEWEDRLKKECKKRHWYDPRGWFCWIRHYLTKVIRWIVVTILKLAITVVCRWIGRILAILTAILRALYLFGKALVTWNKCALQEGLAALGDVLIDYFSSYYLVTEPVADAISRERLRRFVVEEIDARFPIDIAAQLKEKTHAAHGVFGVRLPCTVHRMFVDSLDRSPNFPNVPNLVGLHQTGQIDLYELAGFSHQCALTSRKGWYHPRPQREKWNDDPSSPVTAGGGHAPEFSREELDEYIQSSGARGPHFRIYSIQDSHLADRIDAAEEKGRQLGLILNFEKKDIRVTDARYLRWTEAIQPTFLLSELGRHDKNLDPVAAARELCRPVAVAVFGFTNRTRRGYTSNPNGTSQCAAFNQTASSTSGCSFIDDIPDAARRYVLIHELGHHFGLCHVDGFSKIMVSGAPGQGQLVTAGSLFSFIALGGPRFTLDEAKQVWRYMFTYFPVDALLNP